MSDVKTQPRTSDGDHPHRDPMLLIDEGHRVCPPVSGSLPPSGWILPVRSSRATSPVILCRPVCTHRRGHGPATIWF